MCDLASWVDLGTKGQRERTQAQHRDVNEQKNERFELMVYEAVEIMEQTTG